MHLRLIDRRTRPVCQARAKARQRPGPEPRCDRMHGPWYTAGRTGWPGGVDTARPNAEPESGSTLDPARPGPARR